MKQKIDNISFDDVVDFDMLGSGVFNLVVIKTASLYLQPPIDEWVNPDVVPQLLVEVLIEIPPGRTAPVCLDYDPDTHKLSVDGKVVNYKNIDKVANMCKDAFDKYFGNMNKEAEDDQP